MVAFEVRNVQCTWIKPEGRRLDRYGEIPLSIFDGASSDLHISVLLIYDVPNTASNVDIKLALAKALNYYPILAGKLSHRYRAATPVLTVDADAGVPVLETSVEGHLADFLPFRPSPEATLLHPSTDGSNPLLMIQLNRFQCGGLVLGLSANHMVADGHSMSNFLTSWSRLVLGKEIQLPDLPTHDRSLLSPRDPPMPEFPHQNTEFRTSPPQELNSYNVCEGLIMENVLVHYDSEFIHKLKERSGFQHSTFECLLSHLWKKVTVARGLEPDVVTRARVSVNGRPRLGIPEQYFGNVVLSAFAATQVKDLLEQGDIAYGASLIKDAVGQIGSEYFQSFIDFGELYKDMELYPSVGAQGNVLSPDLEVDSWLGFQFHQVDMGGGAPGAFLPSWIPMEGLVIIIPASTPAGKRDSNGGRRWSSGIHVILTLFPEHAAVFKQIAYSVS